MKQILLNARQRQTQPRRTLAILMLGLAPLVFSGWSITATVLGELPTYVRLRSASDALAEQPWPQVDHDPQRTKRTPIVGPQTATLKTRYSTFADQGIRGPVSVRSGRTYVAASYCTKFDPFFGCVEFFNPLLVLRPAGGVRVLNPFRGDLISNAAVGFDGTIYVASLGVGLSALSPNGEVKWIFPPVGSDPVIGPDGTIYAYGTDLHALNPDGTVQWSVPLADRPITELTIATDGSIYYGSYGSPDDSLIALTPAGVLKWRFPTGYVFQAPPSIAEDGTIYVQGDLLYAVTPDGTLKWSRDVWAGTATIGWDGSVHVWEAGSGDYGFLALTSNGDVKWESPVRFSTTGAAVIGGDGTIYVDDDSGLFALTDQGTLKWFARFEAHFDKAIGRDGTLYVTASNGEVYAFGPGPGLMRQVESKD